MKSSLLSAVVVIAGLVVSPAAQIRGMLIGIDDDPVLGSANAKVTIIEFGDYQCPVCRLFWREVEPRIKKDYIDTGKVRLVFRDFPIDQIHPEAMIASMGAQCALDQGKYWPYHDKLFREQDKRDDIKRFTAGDLKKWAGEIGLDMATFGACLDSGRHRDEVSKDLAEGLAVGIQGTPTFFINGQIIVGAETFRIFQQVIEDALKKP